MNRFGEMHLKNVVFFDDVKFDWGMEGITVIKGKNLNSPQKGRSNGAGKSLLVRQIPLMFYGRSPATLLTKARAKKKAFYRKGASAQLQYHNGKNDILITKMLKGQGFKYDVQLDGTALNHHTATAAEEWIENNFILSETQFYQTAYLDNRRKQPDLLGNDTQRFDIFSDIYRLDDYDALKEHFLAIRATLRDDRLRLQTIEDELESLDSEYRLHEGRTINPKTKEPFTKKHVDAMVVERDDLIKLQHRVEMATSSLAQSARHKTDILFDKKEQSKLLKRRDELQDQLNAHDDYVEWDEENKLAKRKLKAIDKKIVEVDPDSISKGKDLSELLVMETKSDRKLDKLIAQDDDYKEATEKRDSIKAKMKGLSKPERKLEVIEKELSKTSSKLDVVIEKIEQMGNVQKGKCPTCGSKFDPKHIKNHLKDLDKQYTSLAKDVVRLEKEEKDAANWTKLNEQLKAIKVPEPISKKERKTLDGTIEVLGKVIALFKARDKTEVTKKPSGAKELKDPKKVKKELASVKERIHEMAIAQQQTPASVILQTHGFKDHDDLAKSVKRLKKADLGALRSQIDVLSAAMTSMERIKERQKELKPKVKKLIKTVSEANIIEGLISAYSNSGLKRLACADIAKRVESHINDIAPSIFDEGFKFYFDVTPTQFMIRYEDRRGSLFDVSELSGAESGCFNIISMLGILPTLPAEMRTNFMVLDEMDANLDGPSQRMFTNELVPALAEIVPHLIIVTPRDNVYPNSRTCTVVKQGTSSTLVME